MDKYFKTLLQVFIFINYSYLYCQEANTLPNKLVVTKLSIGSGTLYNHTNNYKIKEDCSEITVEYRNILKGNHWITVGLGFQSQISDTLFLRNQLNSKDLILYKSYQYDEQRLSMILNVGYNYTRKISPSLYYSIGGALALPSSLVHSNRNFLMYKTSNFDYYTLKYSLNKKAKNPFILKLTTDLIIKTDFDFDIFLGVFLSYHYSNYALKTEKKDLLTDLIEKNTYSVNSSFMNWQFSLGFVF